MFINNKKSDRNTTLTSLDKSFDLVEGQSVEIGTLRLTYNFLSFPPESYTGDKAEYILAQMRAEERADGFNFSLNEKHNLQKFHEYIIKFLSRADKKITITVSSSPSTTKISEEQAVVIAMEIAKKDKFPDPKAAQRWFKDDVWEIDIQSETHTDIYIHIKINAETGEIVDIQRGSRA